MASAAPRYDSCVTVHGNGSCRLSTVHPCPRVMNCRESRDCCFEGEVNTDHVINDQEGGRSVPLARTLRDDVTRWDINLGDSRAHAACTGKRVL